MLLFIRTQKRVQIKNLKRNNGDEFDSCSNDSAYQTLNLKDKESSPTYESLKLNKFVLIIDLNLLTIITHNFFILQK